jgi:hypothetical protein
MRPNELPIVTGFIRRFFAAPLNTLRFRGRVLSVHPEGQLWGPLNISPRSLKLPSNDAPNTITSEWVGRDSIHCNRSSKDWIGWECMEEAYHWIGEVIISLDGWRGDRRPCLRGHLVSVHRTSIKARCPSCWSSHLVRISTIWNRLRLFECSLW